MDKRVCGKGLWVTFSLLVIASTGCSTVPATISGIIEPQDSGPSKPVDVSMVPDAVPRLEPLSKYGNPPSYVVAGIRYHVLESSAGYVRTGIASWYGTKFHGNRTSSGEPYDMYTMTAAHKTLPLPTYAEVTNLMNGKKVIVKVNDRGPFKENREIDLSYAAAAKLGFADSGTGIVEVRALDPVSYQGSPSVSINSSKLSHQDLYLQVGAFSDRNNAERLKTRVASVTPPNVVISIAEDASALLYRVRIGPIASIDEADRISHNLAQLGVGESRVVVD